MIGGAEAMLRLEGRGLCYDWRGGGCAMIGGAEAMLRSRMYSVCSTSPWKGETFNSSSSGGSRSSGVWIYATTSHVFCMFNQPVEGRDVT